MYPQIDGEQAKLELDFSASLASTATYMHGVDDVIGLHDVDGDDEDDDEEDDDCGPLTTTTTSRSSMTSGGGSSSSSSSSGSNDSSEADVVDDYDTIDEVDGQLQITKTSLEHGDLLTKPTHAIDIIVKKEQHRHLAVTNSCLTTALQIQDIISATTTDPNLINHSIDQIKSEQYNNHTEASTDIEQSNLKLDEVSQKRSNKTGEEKPAGGDIEVKGNTIQEDLDLKEDEDNIETDEDEGELEEGGETQVEDEENEDIDDEEDEDDNDDDEEESEEEDDEDDETDDDHENSNDSQTGQENLYIIDEHHHYPLHHFNHNPHHQLHHNDHSANLFHNSTQSHLSQHNHQHHHHLHLGQSFDQSRYESESHHLFSKHHQEQCQNGLTSHLQNNINHSNHQNANSPHNHHHQSHHQYHLSNEHHLSNHQQHVIDETSSQQYYMTNVQQHHEFQHQQHPVLHQIHAAHHQQNNSCNNDVTNDILIDLIPQNDDCSDLRSSLADICSNDISATTTTTTTTSISLDSSTTTTISDAQLITSNPNISIESNNTTKSAISDHDIVDGERMLEVTRKLVRSTERDPDRDLRKQVLLKTAIKKLPHFMEYNSYNETMDQTFHNNHNMSQQHACYEQHDSQPKFYHSVQPNAIQMSTTSLRMLDLNDDDQDKESQLGSITTPTTIATTTPTPVISQPATTAQNANSSATEYMNETPTIDSSLESNEESSFYQNTSHDSGVFSPRPNKRSSSWVGLDDEMEIDNLTELSTRSQNIESNNLQHIKKLRKREILD